MYDKNRNFKRLRRRLQVRFTHKGAAGTGFTENLSPGGLLLHSNITFPAGSVVSGQLVGSDGKPMRFEAEIRWVRRATGQVAQFMKNSMGIRFVGALDEAYYQLLMQQMGSDGEEKGS